jgi:lysozyme family protein
MLAEDIIEKTLKVEAGYSNNPKDSGGETIWGITIATARENGYTGPMQQMPRATAVEIYKREYLVKPGFDKVLQINDQVAAELYDSGVNCGVGTASEWLQTALNVLNRERRDYPDVVVDGSIGPRTLSALQTFLRLRKLEGEIVLLKNLKLSPRGVLRQSWSSERER